MSVLNVYFLSQRNNNYKFTVYSVDIYSRSPLADDLYSLSDDLYSLADDLYSLADDLYIF